MTPHEFIAKWKPVDLSERSACHEHFLDLCDLLGQPKPVASDPDGSWYTFEKGVRKTEGGFGWADVWMKNHFGWEYKKKRRDLKAAYNQLQQYRESLENPPLLVVCDLNRFEIHTNFTGTVTKVYAFDLDGLAEPANLDVLRKLFTHPETLKPGQTTEALTRQAAELIGQVADGMRVRGIPAPDAAHFLMKLIFCMFAEDIGLLPNKVFTKSLASAKKTPTRLAQVLKDLFAAMAHGGYFGADEILYFNGGLFADSDVIDLQSGEIDKLNTVCQFDWSDVEPSIFGTLFERTLDPAKRSQIGAHYTSREDILTLLEPVMMAPLRREWSDVKAKCESLLPKIRDAVRKRQLAAVSSRKQSQAPKDSPPRRAFDKAIRDFVERLAHVTVLDPACGSGNFLYVAINLLLDLEKQVIAFAAIHGVTQLPQVRPTQLAGIEINPYAQQLAQIVIWIGYLQWMHHNGFNPPSNPVLEPIESIRLMDAIIDLSDREHPAEPDWPAAEFIVGNPPFLGTKMLRGGLGDEYVEKLFALYAGRIPGFSDLCCYWFEKAREIVETKPSTTVGLLATQAIRNDAARIVLERVKAAGQIFFAVSDEEWFLDGAAVHISMVGFSGTRRDVCTLDGTSVPEINANLTAGVYSGAASVLRENAGIGFVGDVKGGPFDLALSQALGIGAGPSPNGRPAFDVIRPYCNGLDVTRRPRNVWVIDFGNDMPLETASAYGAPFDYIATHVKPMRDSGRPTRNEWWLHMRPCQSMRNAVRPLARYIGTPNLTKHRLFVWLTGAALPDHQLIVFARDDDYFLGVLQSRAHEVWARSRGTQLREKESGFRYTPTTCFETFAFPRPTKLQKDCIAAVASDLDAMRNNWLNPREWVREEVLQFPGSVDGPWARYVHDADARGVGTVRYPRLVPKDEECAKELKKRTLTNLYNQMPTWLQLAHKKLDEGVFAAYGWPPDLSDEQILEKLLALNLQRATEEAVPASV
jgi:hypothetical protein